MKKSIIAAPVLALLALAGCASAPSQLYQDATVAFRVSAPPLIHGQIPLVINSNPILKVGRSDTPIGTFVLRECNFDKSACQVGHGKVDAVVTLVSLGDESATVQVSLKMDIGDKVSVESKSATANQRYVRQLDKDMPIITDNQSLTKTVEVQYGVVGRMDMRHGVVFRMCVVPGAPFTGVNSCSGKEVFLTAK